MQIVGKDKLTAFKNEHPEARSQIESWEADVENDDWKTPHDLKERYPKASLPGNQNAVFNICWNNYRLWVKVAYNTGIVLVKAIGTHKEYEKWLME